MIRATASGDALVFETEILKDLEFALRIVSGDGAEGSATRTGAFSRAGETGALRMGLAISLRRSEAIKRSVEYRVRARDCLNVRTQPSLHAPVIGCVKNGFDLRGSGELTTVEGTEWAHVYEPAAKT